MLAFFGGNNRHGNPRHGDLKLSCEGRIVAWRFTKRQPGGRGDYWVLSLSGNCCIMVLMKKTTTVNTLWKVIIACTGVLIVSLGIFAEQVYAQQANREVNNILMRGVRESNKPITTNKDTDEDRRENEENQASLWVIAPADLEAIARRLTAQCDQK